MRFVVVETRGYTIFSDYVGSGAKAPVEPVSYAVLDSAVCYRLCGEFQPGDGRGIYAIPAAKRKATAEALAAELNEAYP